MSNVVLQVFTELEYKVNMRVNTISPLSLLIGFSLNFQVIYKMNAVTALIVFDVNNTHVYIMCFRNVLQRKGSDSRSLNNGQLVTVLNQGANQQIRLTWYKWNARRKQRIP